MPISANLPDAHSFKPPKARKRSIEVSNEDDGPTSRQQSQQKLARIDAEDQIVSAGCIPLTQLVRGLNQLACLFRAFNQYACREDSEQVLVTALWQAAESVLIGVGRIYDELEGASRSSLATTNTLLTADHLARRSVKRPGRKAHVWTLYFRNLPIAFFQERIAHELAALIKRSTFTPQLAPPPHLVARLRELGEYLRLSFRYGRLDKHVKEQIEEWKETEGRAIEDFGLWDPESKGKRRRRN